MSRVVICHPSLGVYVSRTASNELIFSNGIFNFRDFVAPVFDEDDALAFISTMAESVRNEFVTMNLPLNIDFPDYIDPLMLLQIGVPGELIIRMAENELALLMSKRIRPRLH